MAKAGRWTVRVPTHGQCCAHVERDISCVATRTGQASVPVVSRAVEDGTVAFSKPIPAPNHQQQLNNPQLHPYPSRIHASSVVT